MTPAPQADRIDSKLDKGTLARFGLGLANWSERWFPDPLVFAFLGILVVFINRPVAAREPVEAGQRRREGFWSLVPFTPTCESRLCAPLTAKA